MKNRFNLIVSTYRHREIHAQDEIHELLESFGDPEVESEITEIKGIILVRTSLDPFLVVRKLKDLVFLEPWQIRYVLRVLPVEEVVATELIMIKEAAKKLASNKIGSNHTFRITVEKRHSSLGSREVIKAIGEEIDSKVDLENPDWIVLVQVLGRQTGVSVLRKWQIFSSVVERRMH